MRNESDFRWGPEPRTRFGGRIRRLFAHDRYRELDRGRSPLEPRMIERTPEIVVLSGDRAQRWSRR